MGGRDTERLDPDDPYSLGVYLLFDAEEDPAKAKAVADQAADELKALFEKCFLIDERWQNIELRECEAISETELSYRDRRALRAWSFDYLSLD